MQRLVRHRTPMLAIILAVLVALSSTLVMLITMGQLEETPVLKKEANLQEDDQLIASTDVKGKAYFGLGILNPIDHRIITITNNNKDNTANTTFITATANGITNNNKDNKNNNNANANNLDTHKGEENKKNNEATVDVILLKDIECPGIGMIVGADGITINLNNHKLSLVNNTDTSRIPEVEEIGILVPDQKNITIRGPGIISGFDKAIEFAGSGRGYALDLKLTDNNIGLSLKASDGITIYRSFIEQNTIGIVSQSSKDALIVSNQLSQNTNEGIVLMDSNYFIIGANSLIGNGNIGIFLDVSSFNNTISSNNVLNHGVDVSNADGVPIHISMNEYHENSCGKALPDGIC